LLSWIDHKFFVLTLKMARRRRKKFRRSLKRPRVKRPNAFDKEKEYQLAEGMTRHLTNREYFSEKRKNVEPTKKRDEKISKKLKFIMEFNKDPEKFINGI